MELPVYGRDALLGSDSSLLLEAPFIPRDRKPPVRERTFPLNSSIRIGVTEFSVSHDNQDDDEGGKVDDSNHSKPVALELQPPTSSLSFKPTARLPSKVDRELQLVSQRGTISEGEESEVLLVL